MWRHRFTTSCCILLSSLVISACQGGAADVSGDPPPSSSSAAPSTAVGSEPAPEPEPTAAPSVEPTAANGAQDGFCEAAGRIDEARNAFNANRAATYDAAAQAQAREFADAIDAGMQAAQTQEARTVLDKLGASLSEITNSAESNDTVGQAVAQYLDASAAFDALRSETC